MPDRRSLIPPATLPLAYFGLAHLALAAAFAVLAVDPGLPIAPGAAARFFALLHLVTLGWISGSILGALYIVGPLALGVPMRAGVGDSVACGAFAVGLAGMAAGFWSSRFDVVTAGAACVIGAMTWVAARILGGLRHARLPKGVSLHVALAFLNVALAGLAGLVMTLDTMGLHLSSRPLRWNVAHAHLGVLGWACMMIFGVGYRLVPMVIPAAMPTGQSLAVSAVLLQAGALGLAGALVGGWDVRPWGVLVLAAFASFFAHVLAMLRARRPPPADLPRPDWSTRHTFLALSYGVAAAVLGAVLSSGEGASSLIWAYGITGLVGFVSQLVVGIQGRLLPLHAWYREMERLGGEPPPISAHSLASLPAARATFLLWMFGVPLLCAGFMMREASLVAGGAAPLLAATLVNAWHGCTILARAHGRSAREPA
ncbi:MAG: hypothetical protein IT177_22180 [Acidobacteria bacterium]|nr:hypothetical protein [Acidobacteriota bacterium]